MASKVNVSPDTVPLLHVAVTVPSGAHRSRRQSDDLRARPRQLLVVSQNPSHFLLRLLKPQRLLLFLILNQLIHQGLYLKLMLEALLYLTDRLFSLVFGRLRAEATYRDNSGVSTVHAGTADGDGRRVSNPVVGGRVGAA